MKGANTSRAGGGAAALSTMNPKPDETLKAIDLMRAVVRLHPMDEDAAGEFSPEFLEEFEKEHLRALRSRVEPVLR